MIFFIAEAKTLEQRPNRGVMHPHPLGHGPRIAQLIKRNARVLRNKFCYKRLIGRKLTAPSGTPLL